jgi:hypothetical protein
MRKLTSLGVLFLAAGAVRGGEPTRGSTAVFLEPLAEGVARGVSDERCVATLRAALAGKKLKVVADLEEAHARLEVRDCVVHVQQRVVTRTKQTGGEIHGPGPENKIVPLGARGNAQEHEYGAATEDQREALLVVRLSVGERLVVLSSDPRDERLDQAATTVAKSARTWLSESRLPAVAKPTPDPAKPNEQLASNP